MITPSLLKKKCSDFIVHSFRPLIHPQTLMPFPSMLGNVLKLVKVATWYGEGDVVLTQIWCGCIL